MTGASEQPANKSTAITGDPLRQMPRRDRVFCRHPLQSQKGESLRMPPLPAGMLS
jgi:hypothetical protein